MEDLELESAKRKTGRKRRDTGLGNDFLDITPEAQTTKEKSSSIRVQHN